MINPVFVDGFRVPEPRLPKALRPPKRKALKELESQPDSKLRKVMPISPKRPPGIQIPSNLKQRTVTAVPPQRPSGIQIPPIQKAPPQRPLGIQVPPIQKERVPPQVSAEAREAEKKQRSDLMQLVPGYTTPSGAIDWDNIPYENPISDHMKTSIYFLYGTQLYDQVTKKFDIKQNAQVIANLQACCNSVIPDEMRTLAKQMLTIAEYEQKNYSKALEHAQDGLQLLEKISLRLTNEQKISTLKQLTAISSSCRKALAVRAVEESKE